MQMEAGPQKLSFAWTGVQIRFVSLIFFSPFQGRSTVMPSLDRFLVFRARQLKSEKMIEQRIVSLAVELTSWDATPAMLPINC